MPWVESATSNLDIKRTWVEIYFQNLLFLDTSSMQIVLLVYQKHPY